MTKDVTSSGSARTSGVVLAKNSGKSYFILLLIFVITVICIWPLDNQDEAHDQLSEDDAGDIMGETINEAIKEPSEKVD